jgi:hypothetical protein
MLGVSGGTARGVRATDAFEVVLDDAGELCVFVVKVRGPGAQAPGILGAAAAATRVAVKSRLAIYELVAEVRRFASSEQGVEVALALLRYAPRESRVEILNAGMPPIVRFLRGTPPTLYPELSAAIGTRFGEVHPYELSPLVWGSAWAILSDGVTGGSVQPSELTRRVAGSELERRVFELPDQPSAELERVAATLAGDTTEDRTLVVVSADPSHRIESGIEPTASRGSSTPQSGSGSVT